MQGPSKHSRIPLLIIGALTLIHGWTSAQIPSKDASLLAQGEWHKLRVADQGIFEINRTLVDEVGLTPAQGARLSIFGNGGGVLPQLVSATRVDDLEEIATLRIGLDDGSFDQGDKIIFYAEGPDHWTFDRQSRLYHMTKNVYDDYNHYFISTEGSQLAIPELASIGEAEVTFSVYDDYQRIEEDRVNLLGKFRPPGSGQRWFGDEFSGVREKAYNLQFPNIVAGAGVYLTAEFAGRADQSSQVKFTADGNAFPALISKVDLGEVQDRFAKIVKISGSYTSNDTNQAVIVSYPPHGTSSSGWLDYLQLQTTSRLVTSGEPLFFRNSLTENTLVSRFAIQSSRDLIVWNISDPHRITSYELIRQGSDYFFDLPTEGVIPEFVSFNVGIALEEPEYVGPVANQDVHGLQGADLVIIYHEDFAEAAMELAQHRRDHSGYRVAAIPIDAILNEFAGGSMDPTAIRDFAAMLKSRDDMFRYLLLFGDGSYDFRHRNTEIDDDNFIPVYETYESMDPIRSFPSDDYFSLLNPNEGQTLLGAIDIAVGRLPVGSPQEANAVVDKILNYDTSPTTLGDWRQRLAYVADDEDNNLHLNQSEDISQSVEEENPDFNLNRIYLDAFEQLSTPGGPRYPDVNLAINNSMFQGVLAMTYLGHGGHLGWSQERVLGLDDIGSWTNYDRLPIFVTATCSFTGYDEPSYSSAGEQVLLNPNGGSIALLTTVRAVYSGSNKRLTEAVFDRLFDQKDGKYLPIGEIMRIAKNSNARDTVNINARKFAIIGDPSMTLAYPQNSIELSSINGKPITGATDTLRALDRVSIGGNVVTTHGSVMTGFQGELTITVYDKPIKVTTLGNDPKSFERRFENLSRVVFKGAATVENGKFSVDFVIPEDIDFSYGAGKISLYASDLFATDAAGSYDNIIIGGSSPNIGADQAGPQIEAYLNRESFQSGDKVGPNNTLIVKLFDESGINVIGNSIGHDLVAVLDGDTRQSFVLNAFYQANTNDFTRGEVRFPLSTLSVGPHYITVTAWDGANNFSEVTIDFIVEAGTSNAVHSLTNYPNPVSEMTTFRIEHDLQSASIDVEIELYDVMGRIAMRFSVENVPTQEGVIDNLVWDRINGRASALGPGVYHYRALLSVPSTGLNDKIYQSSFNTLILLN